MFAVVMGDIVGSEKLRSSGRLSEQFGESVRATNRQFRGIIASPLTITLGDEFQGLADNLAAGFHIVESMRDRLSKQSIECRFVVGLVRLDSKLNERIAWNMVGKGLKGTRAKLDDKEDPNIYRFSLPDHPLIERLLDAAGLALTIAERHWTDRQREVMRLRLDGKSISAIALGSGVGERSVYKVLRSGNFKYYDKTKETVRGTLASLDEEIGFV